MNIRFLLVPFGLCRNITIVRTLTHLEKLFDLVYNFVEMAVICLTFYHSNIFISLRLGLQLDAEDTLSCLKLWFRLVQHKSSLYFRIVLGSTELYSVALKYT